MGIVVAGFDARLQGLQREGDVFAEQLVLQR